MELDMIAGKQNKFKAPGTEEEKKITNAGLQSP